MAALWAVNASACAPAAVRPGPERQELGWPAYLGSPRHDASARESLNPDPRPLWRTDVGRAVRGVPAVGETILAVGVADRALALLDRASGALLWRRGLDGTVHAGPLLDQDRLYVATEESPEGRVYALRLRDGRRHWSARTGGVEAPLALDRTGGSDALYVGTERGVVLRLEIERGSRVWRRELPGAIRAGPVPTSAGIAVATTSDTLYLLDRETGEVRARHATPGSVLATPASDGEQLIIGTTGGHVLALGLPALDVRWDHRAGDAVLGAPVLARDTVYALTRDGTLWLIPLGRPSGARALELGVVATAAPTPTASGVLVGTVSGELLLVDRADGAVRWRAQVDGPIEAPPVVRDRQLLVAAGRGDVHAYR